MEKGIALKADISIMHAFWKEVLTNHLLPKQAIEEKILYPLFKKFAVEQYHHLLNEEREWSDLLEQDATGTVSLLKQQAEMLKRMVRRKERVYYPSIEPHLNAEICIALQAQTHQLNEACVQPAVAFYK